MDAAILHEFLEYKNGMLFWKKARHGVTVGKEAGTIDANGYRKILINGNRYLTHRAVFFMHNGWMPDQVDHVNGNKLDNKIENLRPATHSQNQRNRKKSKTNTSGVKNVFWHKTHQKWCVSIRLHGKLKNIGYYESIEKARQVAEESRNKYHGSYANNG